MSSNSKSDWFSKLIHNFAGLFDGNNDDDWMYNIHIHYLPEELLLFIFSYLGMADLIVCRRVCSRWRRVGADQRLWRQLSMEYEPGMYAPKKRRELRLVPCVQNLKLLLPNGRHKAFQSRELQLVPISVRNLSVDFVPSTLVLVLQVVEKVLPCMRRLELVAQDELTFFPQHEERYPRAEVKRLWELMSASRLEDLVVRGCCSDLLEKWNSSNVPAGPINPQIRRLEVAVIPKMINNLPTRREEAGVSHDISHTITMLLRAHAPTLRSVTIDVKYEEPHNDLIIASMLCPRLIDLTMATAVFKMKSICSSQQPVIGTLDLEGCGWDKDLIVSFLKLEFVSTRVQALCLTHIDHNAMYVWPTLTKWDRLRFLDIRKCSCLELQTPLSRLVSQLRWLESLRFWKVRYFKDGSQHLGDLSPVVAPRLRSLNVHLCCWKECICDAQHRTMRSFSGTDCQISFHCNYRDFR